MIAPAVVELSRERCHQAEIEDLEGMSSSEESFHSSGPPSLFEETIRTNGSCNKERNEESSLESDDDSEDGQSWKWDPSDDG